MDDASQLPPTPWARAAAADALTALVPSAPYALAVVFIAAAYEGGVTLEWGTDDDRQLIVTIPPKEDRSFSVFRYSVEPRFEGLSAENLASLPELLSWLTNGDGRRGRQLVNVGELEEHWDRQLAAAGTRLRVSPNGH
jgi:hypothetical protein